MRRRESARRSGIVVLALGVAINGLAVQLAPRLAGASIAVDVDGGQGHTCAVARNSDTFCWGDRAKGALGTGSGRHEAVPARLDGLSSTAVAAGGQFGCAITVAGGVVCWGQNSTGQLGDGSFTDRETPVPVLGLSSGVTAIAAGRHHACAVKTDGSAFCWGYNRGRLGDGTSDDSSVPVPVVGLSPVAQIAAGWDHTCALGRDGSVSCWGGIQLGQLGELGDGASGFSPTPVSVVGLEEGASAISAGEGFSCALSADGVASCWGSNAKGQLGVDGIESSPIPIAVDDLSSGFSSLDSGADHTCAVAPRREIRC